MVAWISCGIQIICSSDEYHETEYLSIATGCDQDRNTRLDLVLDLQFTIGQFLLMWFLDPAFESLLTTIKKHFSLF